MHKCDCVCVLVCPACVRLYSVYVSGYLGVYVFHAVCLVSAYTRGCWHVCMWFCCNFLFACSQSFVINRVIHSSSSMASMSNSAPWRHLKRPSWYLQTVADCWRLLQTVTDCCRLLHSVAVCSGSSSMKRLGKNLLVRVAPFDWRAQAWLSCILAYL